MQAESFQELGVLRRTFLTSIGTGIALDELCEQVGVVQDIHEHIYRRSIELAIRHLIHQGMGEPPVPYAFLLFGSGGRMEQTLVSDQDNGLIYHIPNGLAQSAQVEIESYFYKFATTLVDGLAEAGYPPCVGNVICSNQRWRGTEQHWQTLLNYWCEEPTWENMRYLLVLGDARFVAGEPLLFASLQSSYHELYQQHPALVGRLLSNTLHHRVPLGLFGQLLPEMHGKYVGSLPLKNGLYLPFVNCVRFWAIAHGIRATNTRERLKQLRGLGVWSDEFSAKIDRQFTRILGLRLLAAKQWQANNDDYYNSLPYLQLRDLDKQTRTELKFLLKQAVSLQRYISSAYRENLQ